MKPLTEREKRFIMSQIEWFSTRTDPVHAAACVAGGLRPKNPAFWKEVLAYIAFEGHALIWNPTRG